jgi:hypothetical protein
LDLYMETPRRVARLGIQVSGWGTELMGLITDRFDYARVVQLAAFRRVAIDIKAFGGTHRDVCALIVDAPKFDRILAKEDHPLGEVAAGVAAVTHTSQLGPKMIGWAAPYVVSSRLVRRLEGELEHLRAPITNDNMEQIATAPLQELDIVRGDETLATRRTVVRRYERSR